MSADVSTQGRGRQGIPGALSPFPLAEHVPAMLSDDPMIVAFLEALDEVWAPVITTLDCFDAYLDPRLAPPDMVSYLGSWIRALTSEARDEEQLREDVATAFHVAQWCGTAIGLLDHMVPRGADRVEIRDPGGIHTSTVATDPASWEEPEDWTVGITVINPHLAGSRGDERLRRMVRDLVPAHVPVDLQVQ